MIVPARIVGVVTDCVHCCAVLAVLLQWWAGLNRTSANISRRVGSNEAIPIHIDCVPLYRSHTHTDAKHRHIFRAMFPFDPDPHFVPTVYMSLPSLSAAILYAYKVAHHTIDMHLHNLNRLFLPNMDSTRLEMFIPVSFPVEVILSSVLKIVEQEILLHCVFRTTSLYSFYNFCIPLWNFVLPCRQQYF